MNAKGAYTSSIFTGAIQTESGVRVHGTWCRIIVYPKSRSRECWRGLNRFCAQNGISLMPLERAVANPDGRYDVLYAVAGFDEHGDCPALALLLSDASHLFVSWHPVFDAKPSRGSGAGELLPRHKREARKTRNVRHWESLPASERENITARADMEANEQPVAPLHGPACAPSPERAPQRKPRRNMPNVPPVEYSDEQREAALTETFKDESLRSQLLRRGTAIGSLSIRPFSE